MKTLLKNATLISGFGSREADLLIEDGRITRIEPEISLTADREIDCTGKWVLPGMIDTHVHFRDPGLTHKGDVSTESGAAVAGGVTTICDMPNTIPPATTVDAVRDKQRIYEAQSRCNFGLYIGAAKENLEELKKADTDDGIVAIKIFMAESTGEMTLAEDVYLEPIFRETRKLIAVHAEDEPRRLARLAAFQAGELPEAAGIASDNPYLHVVIRDNLCAALGTRHAVDLALKYQHRTHILHMSAAEELDALREGIEAGLVTGETCPQYLLFNREDIKSHGTRRIMNPALKGKEDNTALWRALAAGVISQVTTDHAPHLIEEKAKPYGQAPAGLPGVQFVLPLMLTAAADGLLTVEQVVRLTAENPAANYGIRNKGYLKEGYDADLVIIDPGREHVLTDDDVLSRCAWTPYDGRRLRAVVETTLVNGVVAFENGNVNPDVRGKQVVIG